MTTIREDIATIKSDVRHIIDRLESVDQLEKRVDQIERKGIRVAAYVAGLSTIGGGAAGALLVYLREKVAALFLALFVILFVAGCAGTGPNGADAYWHGSVGPVPVYIHEGMRPECIDAMFAARDLWKEKCLVDYLRPRVVSDSWEGWRGSEAPAGTISVRDATLPLGPLASTQYRRFFKRMRWARIRFSLDGRPEDVCNVHVAAHELGHALGLSDRYSAKDEELLMFWTYDGDVEDDKVTEDECAWVTQ